MISQHDQGLKQTRGINVVGRFALVVVLSAVLGACGGGSGGDSSDDVDLRASYDRINQECMTYSDVERAVGRAADEAPDRGRRNWTSGNQRLYVTFAEIGSNSAVISGVTWDEVPGGELVKSFPIECGGV